MRFHLPALAGRSTDKANSTCAYSQKHRKFARMMRDRGHVVLEYGPGDGPPLEFDLDAWADYNARCAEEIAAEKQPGDFLCVIAGRCQEALAIAHPDLRCVEYGIGYGGVFADFKVFESYAWMHTVYGQLVTDAHVIDGRIYDAVIPNYFEVEDFPEGPGGDYLLYLGRMEWRKGSLVAAQIAERAGVPLKFAGAGPDQPDYGENLGTVRSERRAELLGGAMAILCPTVYVEPFGGAAIEAMLCGTPVIASDWGAFTETVIDGVNGYRCRMLNDYADAVGMVAGLDRGLISRLARRNYSLDAIAPQYESYFEQLQTLNGEGWSTNNWHRGCG